MVREIVMLSIAAKGMVEVIMDAEVVGVMLYLAALNMGSGNKRLWYQTAPCRRHVRISVEPTRTAAKSVIPSLCTALAQVAPAFTGPTQFPHVCSIK